MANLINILLSSLGLEETAFDVEEYTVVPVGCDTWTFSPDHEFSMITESLERYADA